MSTRGKLITFEGGEGSGKSTQIQKLRTHLLSQGYQVILTREPGGTRLGESIRNLLQIDAAGEGMVPEAEFLLFSASRAQLVTEVIRPALLRGCIVLCDRFIDSTYVYQGFARGLSLTHLRAVTGFATGNLKPDLTLLLDTPVAEGMARVHTRGEELTRIEREATEFFERIRAGYLQLQKAEPQRIHCIDARPCVETVHKSILQTVSRVLS
jgi:dTMP kinase